MKFTTQKELKTFMDENYSALFYEEAYDLEDEEAKKVFDDNFKFIDTWNDGDGNPMGTIWYIESLDTYVEVLGYYSSWDSSEAESWYVVYPHMISEVKYISKKQTQKDLDSHKENINSWVIKS